jgi:hypothetical protein
MESFMPTEFGDLEWSGVTRPLYLRASILTPMIGTTVMNGCQVSRQTSEHARGIVCSSRMRMRIH